MSEIDIRKYGVLMAELGLTGLEIRNKDCEVRLERTCGVTQTAPAVVPVSEPVQTAPVSDDCVSITSPMVGVFYQAPAENAQPYVKVGDVVKKGTVLCLIEAMKMMNEITAEEDGVVSEVCVANGQVVDYGRELFRIRR